jgi:hypothetical protein
MPLDGDWRWLVRQSPGRSGVWGDYEFLPSDDRGSEHPDYWVVLGGLSRRQRARVDPRRVILVTSEPQAIHAYQPGFLAQFGVIVTSQERIRGPNVLHMPTGLPWHVGVRRREGQGGDRLEEDQPILTYDDLHRVQVEKTRELSVVCTTRSGTTGYGLRLAFTQAAKEHFGDRMDWFGRGVRPVEDKWDAVAPYRFHISLENTAERDYWSEKLADAYLAWSFPFYWGCTNVDDYFDENALVTIDPARPEWSIQRIEQVLAEGVTRVRHLALETARKQVLDDYNVFAIVASILEQCPSGNREDVRLRPEAEFYPRSPLWRRTASRVKRALG